MIETDNKGKNEDSRTSQNLVPRHLLSESELYRANAYKHFISGQTET
jgi:hypothetical protein